ncbi:ferredoxin [Vermiphilus pyriformis]|nr:MAG: ferredoxin [Vermiphilus pyriformis]
MKKVWIEPGCISCGLCVFLAPEIFDITDSAYVKLDAPVAVCSQQIKQASQDCPVSVIKYLE